MIHPRPTDGRARNLALIALCIVALTPALASADCFIPPNKPCDFRTWGATESGSQPKRAPPAGKKLPPPPPGTLLSVRCKPEEGCVTKAVAVPASP